MVDHETIRVEEAVADDLEQLVEIEEQCFDIDRLSRRSMRRFIASEQSVLLVARSGEELAGYLLIIFHRGTRLARLYSIAVADAFRGKGIARMLMQGGEAAACERGAIHLRLEVGQTNAKAIALYRSLDFEEFDVLPDYYEDHSNAVRMQKRIRHPSHNAVQVDVPWFRQHTPFTCGPAAIMMAMAALNRDYQAGLEDELRLWRETTTIFMTSGHGGCHPIGLALAAVRRGYHAEAWINKQGPLFMEGVRSEQKKQVIQTVHADFTRQAEQAGIPIHHRAIDHKALRVLFDQGAIPIVLISTFRFDRKKAPHWVVVTGYDERCIYVHDPDVDDTAETPRDLLHIPIAVEEFDSMAAYGSSRLRSAVVVSRK